MILFGKNNITLGAVVKIFGLKFFFKHLGKDKEQNVLTTKSLPLKQVMPK
jgi:hypothetical protein